MDRELLSYIIAEDLGDGDHTSLATIPSSATGTAQLLVKESGIIAGVRLAQEIFHFIDPILTLDIRIQDGAEVHPQDVVFYVNGNVRSILQAERIVLNCMQRMSGVATQTKQICDIISDLPTRILDTRKTTPGLRAMEKEAVRIGGGVNHRMGLYDMVMIKDNHIDFAGGVAEAIEATTAYLEAVKKDMPVEVEARNLDEIRTILRVGGVDRILLDNLTPEETKKAVALINGKVETESSGGITLETVRSYAECGVDYISVGALTHSVKSLDLSLKATFNPR